MSNLARVFDALIVSAEPRTSSIGQSNIGNARLCDDEYREKHLPYLKEFPEWYSGSTRVSYIDRKNGRVYKVPLSCHGEEANKRDARHYKGDPEEWLEDVPVAECFMYDDVVLSMELVDPIDWETTDESELPDWIWDIDSEQAGWDSSGQLVAYDM